MMWWVLTTLVGASPAEPAGACAVSLLPQPLVALGSDAEILQTVYMSRWASSTDGGTHWHLGADHCLGDVLYFWQLPADAGRSCMAVLAYDNERDWVEHRCTGDEGRTWATQVVTDPSHGHLLDVTANPQKADEMIAVKTYQDGEPHFMALTASSDGGRTWNPRGGAGSLQIVGLVGEKTALVLKGAGFETYNELWFVPFGLREKQLDGPWKDHPNAQLTQAAVNPSNSNHLLVNVWLPQERRDISYVSHDRGRSFTSVEVPANAVWPLEFVGVEGALLANLRASSSTPYSSRATLYDPDVKTWTNFDLPEYTVAAVARGGVVFATGGNFYRLRELTRDGHPRWDLLEVQ